MQALTGLTGLTSLHLKHSLSFQEVEACDGPVARMLEHLCQLQELELFWQVHKAVDHLFTINRPPVLPTQMSSANHLTKVVLGKYDSSCLSWIKLT